MTEIKVNLFVLKKITLYATHMVNYSKGAFIYLFFLLCLM